MKNKLILAFLSIFIVACSTSKKYMIVEPYNFKTNCIHTAIEDFVENTELAKNDSVYKIIYADSVFCDMSYVGYTFFSCYNHIPGLCAVEMVVTDFSTNNEVDMLLPSHSLIYDGKLFFWFDDNTVATPLVKEELNYYGSYYFNRSVPWFVYSSCGVNMTYFMMKDNLTNYKRILINHSTYRRVRKNFSNYMSIESWRIYSYLSKLRYYFMRSKAEPTYPITYQYPYYQLTLFADHSFEAVAAKESISFSMKDDDFIEPIAQGTFNFLDKDVVELVSSNFTHYTKELEYKLTKSHHKSHDSIYIEVLLSKPLMNRLIRPYRIEYVINGIHYKAQNNEVVIARNTLDSKNSNVSNISLEIFIYAKYPPENGKYYNKIVCENFDISNANTFVFDLPLFTNAFLHRIYFNHQIMPLY